MEQCSTPYEVMNKLYEDEYALWSGWETTQSTYFSGRLAKRESQEWKLADTILAGSQFVIENLAKLGVPMEKCRLVPYAVNVAEFRSKDLISAPTTNGQLNVLFLGAVGVRKGIQYLYKAVGILGDANISVRAAGRVMVKKEIARSLSERMVLLGLAHEQRFEIYWHGPMFSFYPVFVKVRLW